MATIKRDIGPKGKEKKAISPQTGTTNLRGSSTHPNYPHKTNHHSTAPLKNTPNNLKSTVSSITDVSKQPAKKPVSSTNSPHKAPLTRIRSSDKTPTPIQKTRVSTLRPSSVSGKTIAPQKQVPSKNLIASTKDAGKRNSLYARPVSTVKKSSSSIKKKEIKNSTSATKEQITRKIPHEKLENSNIYIVPEPETQPEDQEPSITVDEEQTIQVVSNHEKGVDDLVLVDQEPLHIAQTESESHDKVAKNVTTAESTTVLEHQIATLGIKTEETEDKSSIEETSSKQQELGEQIMIEKKTSNIGESLPENPNEEAEEEEVEEKEVGVVQEEETALIKKEAVASGSEANELIKKEAVVGGSEANELIKNEAVVGGSEANELIKNEAVVSGSEVTELIKKEAAVSGTEANELIKKEAAVSRSEVNESKETERKEVVVEKKQEVGNAAAKQGKKDSALSNNVIEETASKLREQRKNKVRALAGAFETVISLQETK